MPGHGKLPSNYNHWASGVPAKCAYCLFILRTARAGEEGTIDVYDEDEHSDYSPDLIKPKGAIVQNLSCQSLFRPRNEWELIECRRSNRVCKHPYKRPEY